MAEGNDTGKGLDRTLSRRNFFKVSGMAAAGAAFGLGLSSVSHAAKPPTVSTVSNDTDYWQWVQDQFVLDPDIVYMNLGTTGSMPLRVLEKYNDYNILNARHPRTFESELGATFGLEDQRATLAAQFGCNTDEICLTRNTTDGLDAVVNGLEFNEGDEILITHHEHIGALSPLNVLQDRYGVILTEVEIPVLNVTDKDQFVNAFEDKISDNTKAILFSHITYKTGTRLPAKALCKLARKKGLISIVDGAHAPGMIELDFHDIGCDFYAAAGHKWQCGPGATGILYLRNGGRDLPTFWTQNSSLYTYTAQSYARGEYDIAYSLQYRGQLNIPAHLAMLESCALWEEIGRGRIEEYVCGLGSYLKQRLRDKFGSTGTLFSPDLPGFTTGLTAFNPFAEITDADLITTMVDSLHEKGYQVRYTNFRVKLKDAKDAYALRISTHLFHNRQQIDGLVDAIYDVL
ncbi:aminotransferase [Desulfosarcina ovata subsp. sediminis]|uniref:Aminotransferase n=1 Tax=Desulfosarcina ovata subsp. sediminis TaxID=885957 RepID=A0A5K7ZRZ6_9BACT|nr:aminotransferase class V-fold PLP-dependent enzyme [Desulfosarcina ovata]BBO82990.1 aminotransferase [Desulfosarcina ovata subsp. sediminis]